MGDEYQVIARAVRRPMQRWWRTVGVWWVALPCQVLIAYGYYWFIRGLLVLGAARRQASAA